MCTTMSNNKILEYNDNNSNNDNNNTSVRVHIFLPNEWKLVQILFAQKEKITKCIYMYEYHKCCGK